MKFHTGKDKVLVIGDTHSPFCHKDTIAFLKAVEDRFKPTLYVHMGDEADCAAISNYLSDPDGMSAGYEHRATVEQLKYFYKAFPKVMVCNSNHTSRIYKRAFGAGIPSKFLKSVSEILEAPVGWVWQDRWIVDGIIYEHGEGYSGAAAAKLITQANMKSTIIGHIHSHAGIQYVSNPYELLFGFNVGCLIDESAYAFNYSKHMKSKPVIGCGFVDKGMPFFIPMIQDKYNRWIGRL